MANPPTRSRRWSRKLGWSVFALTVLLIVGIAGGRAAIAAYLRSDGFRAFLAQRAGQSLQAEVEVAPLSFTGLNVYGNGFHARGVSGAAFSDLRMEGIRAELSLRRFFDRVWQVDSLHAERVQLSLDAPSATTPLAPESKSQALSSSQRRPGWLPNRVEISRADVSAVQLRWPGGGVSGLAVGMSPQEGGWRIVGSGGHLEHRGQPSLEIQSLRMLYRAPALFVQNAELRPAGGGTIRVTGDVQFDHALQLRAEFDSIPLDPLLREDWRVRLHGKVSGEVDIRSPLPSRDPPTLRGTARLIDSDLTALPVLDQIALFTRTQQFRRLKLTRVSADFEQTGPRLEIRNLIAESARLIRIEGHCTIERDIIDGTFQVGVTAASLQWLPGSQERVFTEVRDGYFWAPMRLTGPVGKPQDDLTPRLVAATGEAVLDTAQGTVKDAIKTGRDVLKGALDLLLPVPK